MFVSLGLYFTFTIDCLYELKLSYDVQNIWAGQISILALVNVGELSR